MEPTRHLGRRRQDLDPTAHLAAGEALTALRDQGVLIIGSGMSFHNMWGYNDPTFTEPSEAFDSWLSEAVEASPTGRRTALEQWSQAPCAHQCHPPGSRTSRWKGSMNRDHPFDSLANIDSDQLHPINTDALAHPDDPRHPPRILVLYGSLRSSYLTDRYSERVESAEAVSHRVNQGSL